MGHLTKRTPLLEGKTICNDCYLRAVTGMEVDCVLQNQDKCYVRINIYASEEHSNSQRETFF